MGVSRTSLLIESTIDYRGGGIGNSNTFYMENSWWMHVTIFLCTSRGCSDRDEHLEIAANALEITVY